MEISNDLPLPDALELASEELVEVLDLGGGWGASKAEGPATGSEGGAPVGGLGAGRGGSAGAPAAPPLGTAAGPGAPPPGTGIGG